MAKLFFAQRMQQCYAELKYHDISVHFLTSVHVCALCRVTRTTTRYPGMSDSILKSSLHFRVWDELDDAIAFLFPAI